MAIALRPQICDVTSPYVYAKLGLEAWGRKSHSGSRGEAPSEDRGAEPQKLKKFVTTLNFEANCKEITKIKIIIF